MRYFNDIETSWWSCIIKKMYASAQWEGVVMKKKVVSSRYTHPLSCHQGSSVWCSDSYVSGQTSQPERWEFFPFWYLLPSLLCPWNMNINHTCR